MAAIVQPDYILRIRPTSDPVPVEQRLRHVLKLLKRYGFKVRTYAAVQRDHQFLLTRRKK